MCPCLWPGPPRPRQVQGLVVLFLTRKAFNAALLLDVAAALGVPASALTLTSVVSTVWIRF